MFPVNLYLIYIFVDGISLCFEFKMYFSLRKQQNNQQSELVFNSSNTTGD